MVEGSPPDSSEWEAQRQGKILFQEKQTFRSSRAPANEEHSRNHGFWMAWICHQYSRNTMENRAHERKPTQRVALYGSKLQASQGN